MSTGNDSKSPDRPHGEIASIPHFQLWVAWARVGLDAAAIAAGCLLGFYFRFGLSKGLDFPPGFAEIAGTSVVVGCLSCSLFGLYGPHRSFLDILEQRQLLRASVVGASGTRLLLFLMHVEVNIGLFAAIWTFAVFCLHFGRRAFHAIGEALRSRGLGEVAALIYGAGRTGVRLARQLRRIPELGVVPVGFIDDLPELKGREIEGIPVVGDFLALEGWLKEGKARRVYIALPQVPRRTVLDILQVCRKYSVPFQIVPTVPEPLLPMVELRELEGIPLLGPPRLGLGRLDSLRKRALDLLAVPFLGAASVVVWGLVLVLWRRRSESVLVRTRMIGHRGKLILVRRFRTEWSTPGGGFERFLRSSGLDSLPMVWNLLLGEVTLVGPRPLLPREAAQIEAQHLFRLELRPGFTGLWRIAQVEEGYFDELESELQYLRQQSLLLDLSILLRTLDLPWRRSKEP